MNRIYSLIIFKILCFFLFCISACASSDLETGEDASTQTDKQPSGIMQESVNYYSYPSLAEYSDIVIIGSIVAEEELFNGARDPNDHNKALSYFFSVNQVYRVEVEEYLIGRGPDEISITQWQGETETEKALSPAEIDQIKARNLGTTYPGLDINKRYLMFLRIFDRFSDYQIGSYRSGDLFTAVSDPWLFDITNPDCATPVSTTTEANIYFPPQPIETILKQLEEPFNQSYYGAVMRYPPPLTNESIKCLEAIKAYPPP